MTRSSHAFRDKIIENNKYLACPKNVEKTMSADQNPFSSKTSTKKFTL